MDARALINSAKRRRLSGGDTVANAPPPARVLKLTSSVTKTIKLAHIHSDENPKSPSVVRNPTNGTGAKNRNITTENGKSDKKRNTQTNLTSTIPPKNNPNTDANSEEQTNNDFVSITASSLDFLLNNNNNNTMDNNNNKNSTNTQPKQIINLNSTKTKNVLSQLGSPPPQSTPTPTKQLSKTPAKQPTKKSTSPPTKTLADNIKIDKLQATNPQSIKLQPAKPPTPSAPFQKPEPKKPSTLTHTPTPISTLTPTHTSTSTSTPSHKDFTSIDSISIGQLLGTTKNPPKNPTPKAPFSSAPSSSSIPHTATFPSSFNPRTAPPPPPASTPLSDLTYITSVNLGNLLQSSNSTPPPPAPPRKKMIKLTSSAPLSSPTTHTSTPSHTPTTVSRKRPLSASISTLSPASAKLQKMIKLKNTPSPSTLVSTHSTTHHPIPTTPKQKILKLSSSTPLPTHTPTLTYKTVKISSLIKTTTTQTTKIAKKENFVMFPDLDEGTPSGGAEDFLSTLSSLLDQ